MALCLSSPHTPIWGLRGLEGVARSAGQYPYIQRLWHPSAPLLSHWSLLGIPLSTTGGSSGSWWQCRCSKWSQVILGRREKGWEGSQSLLAILKLHFTSCFAITECYPWWWPERVFPLCFREMISHTWLGGCWESIQSRAMEARRTSSLPEARREHSWGRTFSATISAWMSTGVGKQRRSGGFRALQGVIQALTQTVDCCIKLEGTSPSPCDGQCQMFSYKKKPSFVLPLFAEGLIQAWWQNVGLGTLSPCLHLKKMSEGNFLTLSLA